MREKIDERLELHEGIQRRKKGSARTQLSSSMKGKPHDAKYETLESASPPVRVVSRSAWLSVRLPEGLLVALFRDLVLLDIVSLRLYNLCHGDDESPDRGPFPSICRASLRASLTPTSSYGAVLCM